MGYPVRGGDHLLFDILPRPEGRKTDIIEVFNNNEEDPIGTICWLSPWRQYVLRPMGGTAWSRSCLREVDVFIEGLMQARKLHNKRASSYNLLHQPTHP